jgi:hypothetical protein
VFPGHLTAEQIQRPARRDAPPDARARQPPGHFPRAPGIPGRIPARLGPTGGITSSAMTWSYPSAHTTAAALRHEHFNQDGSDAESATR